MDTWTDRSYFARLTRAENARCERHRAHGYSSAFGVGCLDCIAVQREALAFRRAQREAQADAALDTFGQEKAPTAVTVGA